MALFTRKRKSDESRSLTPVSAAPLLGLSGAEDGPGPSGALSIADAYACVRALSDAAASLPLHTYRRTNDGRERVEGRASKLIGSPAPATTTANLIGQVIAHLNLHGNAYIGKFREDGEIKRLSLISPDAVTPEVKNGRLTYKVATETGLIECSTTDIIHIKAMTVNGLVGLSPVRQAQSALGLSKSLTSHAASTFSNGGRVSGVLKIGSSQNDATDRLAASWNAGHSGADNAGKVAVLTGDVEFTPISMPLTDAQFLEQRRYSAAEVARIFRVPPWIIGADSGSDLTYSNTEQQGSHFVTFSLRPWLVLIEQALSADTDLFPANHFAEFKLDALLRADSKTRAEVYALALNSDTGWMTREEVRRLENLEPE